MEFQFKSKYVEECKVEARWEMYKNGQPALQLWDVEEDEPVAMASVALDEARLGADEILIKNWSENEGVLEALEKAGVVKATGRTVSTGFVEATVCQILQR